MRGISQVSLLRAFNGLCIAGIFVLDAVTSADNVSLGFAYTIPIVLGILESGRASFWYAALASVATVAGSFIQPPNDEISLIFVANRIIAVGTQWMLALLVHYRLQAEEVLRHGLEDERRKVERQRRFISMLSHEVKTPLSTIDGQAYRLEKLHGTIAPNDILTRAGKIRTAVQRVNGIIEGVLLSSSIGTGEIPVAMELIDLQAVIADVVQNGTDTAASSLFQCDLARLPDSLEGDPALLSQVFPTCCPTR